MNDANYIEKLQKKILNDAIAAEHSFIGRVPNEFFRTRKKLSEYDISSLIAIMFREDFTNAKAYTASLISLMECELNGVYGIMVAHNGVGFANKNTINTALQVNKGQSQGLQGGGAIAVSTIIPQPKAEHLTFEMYWGSKTLGEGFQAQYLRFKPGTTRTGSSNSNISDTDIMTESELQRVFGEDYDNYAVFIFRPISEKMILQRRIVTPLLIDPIGIVLSDMLDDTIKVELVCPEKARPNVRQGKKVYDNAYVSVLTPLSNRKSRFIVQNRDNFFNKLPELKQIKCSTEFSYNTSDDGLCIMEGDIEIKLAYGMSRTVKSGTGDSRHPERKFIRDSKDLAHYSQNMFIDSNARMMVKQTPQDNIEYARCFEAPMSISSQLLDNFIGSANIIGSNIKYTDKEVLEILWDNVFYEEFNPEAISYAVPYLDVTVRVAGVNEAGIKQVDQWNFDYLFMHVENSTPNRIMRELVDQLIEDENEDFLDLLQTYRDYFKIDTSSLVQFDLSGSGKGRRNVVALEAYYCFNGEKVNATLTDKHAMLEDAVVLKYAKTGEFFNKDIDAPNSVSRGFSVTANPVSSTDETSGRPYVIRRDKSQPSFVKHLRFNDTDNTEHKVVGVINEILPSGPGGPPGPGNTRTSGSNPDGKDSPNKFASDIYFQSTNPNITGYVRNRTLYLNTSNILIAELFRNVNNDKVYAKQRKMYDRALNRLLVASAVQSKYRVPELLPGIVEDYNGTQMEEFHLDELILREFFENDESVRLVNKAKAAHDEKIKKIVDGPISKSLEITE